jgi:ribosome maturation factor RimP
MSVIGFRDEIAKIVASLGFELYDLSFFKQRKDNILQVQIERFEGVDIDDCVKVSDAVSKYLDETDPISEDYSLEVTTPGAERKLRNREEILRAVKQFIHVETYNQKLEGTLMAFKDDKLFLTIKNKEIEINYLDCTLIRLAIKF